MSGADTPLLELEGLKQWRPGRTSGYDLLETAVDRLGYYAADGTILDRWSSLWSEDEVVAELEALPAQG